MTKFDKIITEVSKEEAIDKLFCEAIQAALADGKDLQPFNQRRVVKTAEVKPSPYTLPKVDEFPGFPFGGYVKTSDLFHTPEPVKELSDYSIAELQKELNRRLVENQELADAFVSDFLDVVHAAKIAGLNIYIGEIPVEDMEIAVNAQDLKVTLR